MISRDNTHYIRTDNIHTDILYSYNDTLYNEIDYSLYEYSDECIPEGNPSPLGIDMNNDDLIIIGIVLFLFAENSVDFTTLAALGLLLFSNNS